MLSELFHEGADSTVVRVATFIDHLAKHIRFQLQVVIEERLESTQSSEGLYTSYNYKGDNILSVKGAKKKKAGAPPEEQTKGKISPYITIASHMVEFLIERNVIRLTDEFKQEAPIVKKGDKYIKYKSVFIQCLFDLKLLPIKMNLPMVSIPKQWEIENNKKFKELGRVPQMHDLVGGYYTYSLKSSMLVNRYRMLTSREYNHFNIRFTSLESCRTLCVTITLLQSEPFIINSLLLSYVKEHQDLLVQKGLLMPPFLANVNPSSLYDILRGELLLEENQKGKLKFASLVEIWDKRIQRARYEQFLLELASVYEGYCLYFPAFLDFRGRIYRTGFLHFHERDLSRSMILFSGRGESDFTSRTPEEKDEMERILWWSAASHYKTFSSQRAAKLPDEIPSSSSSGTNDENERMVEYAAQAKDPFQFLSHIVHIYTPFMDRVSMIPVSMDASSSAYQIMSYLLLDRELGIQTNLRKCDYLDRVYDLYDELLSEIKEELNFSG